MDTAYVRENPPQIAGYKVQYLQFRYLKVLMNFEKKRTWDTT